jgi:hypothetical protein
MDADVHVDPNQMLTTEAAARLIGLKASTLAAWREDGSQPDLAFFKVGKAIGYRYRDLMAFVESRRAYSTVAAPQIVPRSLSIKGPPPRALKKRRRHHPKGGAGGGDGQMGQLKLF